MQIEKYILDLYANTATTISLAKSFSAEELSLRKDGEGWSILEVLEHIYMVDRVVCILLQRPAEFTADKPENFGDDKMNRILVGLRSRKVQAPDNFKPKGIFSSASDFEEKFSALRSKLREDIISGKIIIDNRVQKHPFLGEMTISDWLYFIIRHTQRHIEQIHEIHHPVNNNIT